MQIPRSLLQLIEYIPPYPMRSLKIALGQIDTNYFDRHVTYLSSDYALSLLR